MPDKARFKHIHPMLHGLPVLVYGTLPGQSAAGYYLAIIPVKSYHYKPLMNELAEANLKEADYYYREQGTSMLFVDAAKLVTAFPSLDIVVAHSSLMLKRIDDPNKMSTLGEAWSRLTKNQPGYSPSMNHSKSSHLAPIISFESRRAEKQPSTPLRQ